jgi:hypothetical protein
LLVTVSWYSVRRISFRSGATIAGLGAGASAGIAGGLALGLAPWGM